MMAARPIDFGPPPVVGLDMSLKATGIASSRGWVDTVGAVDVTKMPMPRRVATIDRLVGAILEIAGKPDLVVIEAPSFRSAGISTLERSALWWLLVRALIGRAVPVAFAPPSTRMRYATGKGFASKSAIVDAVARRWPAFQTGGDDNIADAVVLAAMGADRLGHPLAELPKTHRAALDGVAWPEGES